MTVSSVYEPVQYTGNGVTTGFAFPYIFYDDTDIIVTLTLISTGANTPQVNPTDYTLTGGDGETGTVNFVAAPSALYRVTIERDIPYLQEDNYVEGQAFPAQTIETAFDKGVMRDQQINSALERTIKYPATVAGITSVDLPAPEDGKALVFDGTTGAIVASDDYIAEAVADATAAVTGINLITATSTTSLTVTGSGSKIWTIQPNRGFAMGQRLRAASDDGTKINEGLVVAYSDTSLTINVDYVSGSGTHADWNISVIGDRGASGVGSGDMLAANNLSDVASAATSFNTIKQVASTSNTGVVEKATVAEMIAETADKYPDAALLKQHPGVAVAWGSYKNLSSFATYDTYNITSIVDTGTGIATVTLANDMANDTYIVLVSGDRNNGGSESGHIVVRSRTAGTFTIRTYGNGAAANTLVDWDYVSFVVFGTLA